MELFIEMMFVHDSLAQYQYVHDFTDTDVWMNIAKLKSQIFEESMYVRTYNNLYCASLRAF